MVVAACSANYQSGSVDGGAATDGGGKSDGSSSGSGSGSGSSSGSGSDGGACDLTNANICNEACGGGPCSCQPVSPSSTLTTCGPAGTGTEAAPCTSVTQCAPGYDCYGMMYCVAWCHYPSGTCPAGNCDGSVIYNGQMYGICM